MHLQLTIFALKFIFIVLQLELSESNENTVARTYFPSTLQRHPALQEGLAKVLSTASLSW
jgi:hypothetical protein